MPADIDTAASATSSNQCIDLRSAARKTETAGTFDSGFNVADPKFFSLNNDPSWGEISGAPHMLFDHQQLLLAQLQQLQQQQQLLLSHQQAADAQPSENPMEAFLYSPLLLHQQQQQQLQQLLMLQQQMQQLQCSSTTTLPMTGLSSDSYASASIQSSSLLSDSLGNTSPGAFTHRSSFRPLTRAASSPMVASGGTLAAAAVAGKDLSNNSYGISSPVNPSPVHSGSSFIASHVHSVSTDLNNALWTGCSSPGPSAGGCTALITELAMLKHSCACGERALHLERPARLQALLAALQDSGLASKCVRLRARKATFEELESVHGPLYCQLFGCGPLARQKLDASQLAELPIKSFVRLGCGGVGVDSDTTWNEMFTPAAARLAAGCVIELALKVARGIFSCKHLKFIRLNLSGKLLFL